MKIIHISIVRSIWTNGEAGRGGEYHNEKTRGSHNLEAAGNTQLSCPLFSLSLDEPKLGRSSRPSPHVRLNGQRPTTDDYSSYESDND